MTLPKPYYETELGQLYHADCLDILPHLEPVDLVLTDPPYGICHRAKQTEKDRIRKRRGCSNTWDASADWDVTINQQWGAVISKSADVVFWFGHWRKREEVAASIKHDLRAEIVWAKNCHTGPPCPVAPRDERIWVFSKNGFKGITFETSVWDEPIIPTWAYRNHITEKPLALVQRLIIWSGKQTILDPFLGSGTTAVACERLKRKWIGIEIEEKYCEIAAKRIEAERKQLKLF